jgi:hypothetical protein
LLYDLDWPSFKNILTDKNFVGSRVGYNFSGGGKNYDRMIRWDDEN